MWVVLQNGHEGAAFWEILWDCLWVSGGQSALVCNVSLSHSAVVGVVSVA